MVQIVHCPKQSAKRTEMVQGWADYLDSYHMKSQEKHTEE